MELKERRRAIERARVGDVWQHKKMKGKVSIREVNMIRMEVVYASENNELQSEKRQEHRMGVEKFVRFYTPFLMKKASKAQK